MTASHEANTTAHLAALETRVDGIETGLRGVSEGVKALNAKMDARSQTQWGSIWSAAGVATAIIVAIGGAVYAPIHASVARVEEHLERIRDSAVSRSEADRLWAWQTREDARQERRLDRLEERLFR